MAAALQLVWDERGPKTGVGPRLPSPGQQSCLQVRKQESQRKQFLALTTGLQNLSPPPPGYKQEDAGAQLL